MKFWSKLWVTTNSFSFSDYCTKINLTIFHENFGESKIIHICTYQWMHWTTDWVEYVGKWVWVANQKKKKKKKSNAIITDNDTIFTNTLSLIITRHTQRVGIKLCQFLWQQHYYKKKKKRKKKKGGGELWCRL